MFVKIDFTEDTARPLVSSPSANVSVSEQISKADFFRVTHGTHVAYAMHETHATYEIHETHKTYEAHETHETHETHKTHEYSKHKKCVRCM